MEQSSYKNKTIEKKYSNFWNDWWVDYIPKPARKFVGGLKDEVVSLFNINAPKKAVYGKGKKLSKPKMQKQSGENIINSIRNPFILKKEKKKKLKIE